MEGEYRSSMQKKELCLWEENGTDGAGYYTRMMQYNRIPGVLPFTEVQMEGQKRFRYEIGTKSALTECREYDKMNHVQIEKLVRSIVEIIEHGREYLIHERDYVLKPEYIFLTPDSEQVYLCCYPAQGQDFGQQLAGLFEYLLSHIDYQDFAAVEMAYGLYMKSKEAECRFADLLEVFGRSEKSDEAVVTEQEKIPNPFEEIEKVGKWSGYTERQERESQRQPVDCEEPVSGSTGYCLRAESLADSLDILSFPCFISSLGEVFGADDGAPVLGKTQAKISMQRESVYIEDMKSEKGTFVNGRRIAGNEIHKLNLGDSVMLADRCYRFVREG